MNEESNRDIEANKNIIEGNTEAIEEVETIEVPSTQPKRKERTQKQKDALLKAREKRQQNIADKKQKKLMELPPKNIQYKPKPKPIPMIEESEEPQKVIIRRVKKKKKKKPIIIEEEYSDYSDEELTEDDINEIVNNYRKSKKMREPKICNERDPNMGEEWIDDENKLYTEEPMEEQFVPYDFSNNFC